MKGLKKKDLFFEKILKNNGNLLEIGDKKEKKKPF